MIREFQFSFEDLGIVPGDIAELMGFEHNLVPEPFPELIDKALISAPKFSNIRCGYKIFNQPETAIDTKSIRIGTHVFYPSKVILTQFKNATSFALFVCTAGNEITQQAIKYTSDGDPLLGYAFDVVGSLIADKASDKLQSLIKFEIQKTGMKISDRFSPGYCDWSVAEQQKLFALLPDNFCGVTLSESSLMWPIKSVSGIIAIGAGMKQIGYQCRWCTDKTCLYGKIKRRKKI